MGCWKIKWEVVKDGRSKNKETFQHGKGKDIWI